MVARHSSCGHSSYVSTMMHFGPSGKRATGRSPLQRDGSRPSDLVAGDALPNSIRLCTIRRAGTNIRKWEAGLNPFPLYLGRHGNAVLKTYGAFGQNCRGGKRPVAPTTAIPAPRNHRLFLSTQLTHSADWHIITERPRVFTSAIDSAIGESRLTGFCDSRQPDVNQADWRK